MDISVAAGERIARTNVNAAYNEAQKAVYDANSDIIAGYQWEATLDDRTTLICFNLHGSFWPTGSKTPGPPAHWNCRSILIPVFKDPAVQDLVTQAPRRARYYTKTGKPTTRLVAGDTTPTEWLRSQPKAIQRNVLGTKLKTDLFRANLIGIDDLVDPSLRVLNDTEIIKRASALHPNNQWLKDLRAKRALGSPKSAAAVARSDAALARKQPWTEPQEPPVVDTAPAPKPKLVGAEAFPEQYNQWVKSLSEDERSALMGWGRMDWKDIRRAQLGQSVPPRIREELSNLNSALSRAPVREQTVYRGLSKVSSKSLDRILTSKTLTWKTHASSTKSMQKGRGFAMNPRGNNILFEIRQKSGVEIERLVVAGEQEVILLQKTKYHVLSSEWKSFRNPFFKEKVRYVYMVLEEI
jgi:SPP1 gp7 family putative phage head morphogenesis protein